MPVSLPVASYGHHEELITLSGSVPHDGALIDAATKMVGVVELESTTFCSQSRRATRLRYTPKWWYPPPDLNRHALRQ